MVTHTLHTVHISLTRPQHIVNYQSFSSGKFRTRFIVFNKVDINEHPILHVTKLKRLVKYVIVIHN